MAIFSSFIDLVLRHGERKESTFRFKASNMPDKCNLFLSTLWFLVCIAGNVYQIVQITDHYLKYEIQTTVTVDFPKEFVAPTVSYCFKSVEIINWQKLLAKRPFLKPVIKKMMHLKNGSIPEIIDGIDRLQFVAKARLDALVFGKMSAKDMDDITHKTDEIFTKCGTISNIDYRISNGGNEEDCP